MHHDGTCDIWALIRSAKEQLARGTGMCPGNVFLELNHGASFIFFFSSFALVDVLSDGITSNSRPDFSLLPPLKTFLAPLATLSTLASLLLMLDLLGSLLRSLALLESLPHSLDCWICWIRCSTR